MSYAVLGDADRSEIECSAAAKMAELGLRSPRMNWPPPRLAGNRHERRRAEAERRREARRKARREAKAAIDTSHSPVSLAREAWESSWASLRIEPGPFWKGDE